MNIRSFKGKHPVIDTTAYIDEAAVVIGDVTIGAESSLWPMVVARGDVQSIRIGHHTNIQDGSVLHVTDDHMLSEPGGTPLLIGDYVTVGHKVMLHACTIGNHCLIGMSAIILDKAVVPDYVIVGAGSLVPPGKELESGYIYMGNPAQKARKLKDKELEFLEFVPEHYASLKNQYLKEQAQNPRT